MTHNPEFLQAIIDQPENLDLRLVYSDWLEENGQRDRAQLIRLQIELSSLPITPSDAASRYPIDTATRKYHATLQEHIRLLLAGKCPGLWEPNPGNGWYWSGPLQEAGLKVRWEFKNGFPEIIKCPLEVWLKYGKAISRSTPITHLEITDKDPESYQPSLPDGESSNLWYWVRETPTIGYSPYRHYLPESIFELIEWEKVSAAGMPHHLFFDTHELAREALVSACLRYGKAAIESGGSWGKYEESMGGGNSD